MDKLLLLLLSTQFIITWSPVSSRELHQNPHNLFDNYDEEPGQGTQNQLHPHTVPINLDSVYTNKNKKAAAPAPIQQNKSQRTCVSCSKNNPPYSHSHAYIKRMVNLILNSLYLDKQTNLPLYQGRVTIRLTEENYLFLREFAGGLTEENIDDLKKVDSIVTQAFDKSFYEKSANWFASIGDQVFNMMFNKVTAVLVCAAFVLSFVFRLIRGNFSTWEIIKCLLFLLYISDFLVTYLHLYEVEEVRKYVDIKTAGGVPPECDPSKMSYMQYISYIFKNEHPCAKYYKATHENIVYVVVPIKVIKHQITSLLGLMKEVGGAFGDFCGEMFVRLPWGLNIILWPIVLVFFLLLTLITYSSIFDRTIKFNLFHLLKIEFGGARSNGSIDTISGNNLTSLLSSHRQFIESVQVQEKSDKVAIAAEEPSTIKKKEQSEKNKVRRRRNKEKNGKIQDDKEESDKEPKQSKSCLNVQEEDNKT